MAIDTHIKLTGIPGEGADNEIEVLSYSFGISRRNDRSRPNIQDFSIVKKVDTASPLLFDASCQGTTLPDAFFTARKSGEGQKDQQEFLKITFENVVISSVQHSGSAGTDAEPLEQVSLDFRSMQMEVFQQNEDGSLGGSTKTTCSARR